MKCIKKFHLCDGVDHCGDNSDELKSRCSYLRSGDKITLKNNYFKRYLNGANCVSKSTCFRVLPKTSTCGGNELEGSEWRTCSNQVFTIYKKGAETGEGIHNGDTIAIKIGKSGMNYWLACSRSDYAGYGSSCSDYNTCTWIHFKMYVLGMDDGCSGDVRSSCTGKLINKEDHVYLAYVHNYGRWLTSYKNESVGTLPCPSSYKPEDWNSCSWESWILNIQ